MGAGLCYLALGGYEAAFRLEGTGFRPAVKTYTTRRSLAKPRSGVTAAPFTGSEKLAPLYELDDTVETALTDTLDRDKLFIEGYGLTQRLLGRRVMEDAEAQYTVVRLSDGSLVFADPEALPQTAGDQAAALAAFRDTLSKELDIPLLYVQAPQKYDAQAGAALPDGLTDFANPQADELLQRLTEAGVDTLDLRPVFRDTGRYSSLFFTTDHHWTAEGAFIGWQALAIKLESDYGFSIDDQYINENRWERSTLESFFLGSQGKRVGSAYAGLDDFEVWLPRFPTRLSHQIPMQGYLKEGSFEDTLLFPKYLEEGSLYDTNPYVFYSGGDHAFARMKNLANPDGPTVVLLRDSFACPFAPFMALGCGELVTIDLRYFKEDLMTYLSWVEADLVVTLYSPGSLTNQAMFTFEAEEVAP